MALYGGAVGGYTTPDGRVVQMPSNLATMFPSLTPQVQAPGPPPPGQGVGASPDPAAAMLPPTGGPAGPPPGAPDPMTALPLPAGTNPTWSPQDSAELAQQTQAAKQAQDNAELQDLAKKQKTNPAIKRMAASTSQDTTPANQTNPDGTVSAKPLTNTDLAKMGVATPTNAALAAEEEKKKATGEKTAAEAEQATQVAAAMKANEAADKKRLDDMQAEADRRQAQLDEHNAALMAQAKKIADTKIDRTADHPWLTAIGVALATLGTAMQNRDAALAAAFRGQAAPAPIENPGLKAMYAAIDRKVAAQMQDLDKQKDAYGLQQQAVTNERGILKDRLDQMAALRVGRLEQAKQEIDRITKETSVPIIKANGGIIKADITREQATTVADAQQRVKTQQNAEAARAQELKIAQMQNATTIRGQDVQLQATRETIAAQNQRTAAEIAQKMLAEGKSEAAAKMKIIGEQGIRDPSTGNFMLTPAGQDKMRQADAAEAKARAATDPTQAAALNQQAKDLRESALTVDAALADNPKVAAEAKKAVDSAQEMANKTDLARRALQQDPSPANREAWAELTTRLQFIKAQAAKGIGERVSVRAMEALDDVLSIEPDSLWSRAVDKGKAIKALDTLDSEFSQSADVALKSAGVKSGWKPARAPSAPKFSGKTAGEAAEGQLPAAGVPEDNGAPVDPTKTYIQNNAANPGRQAQQDALGNQDSQQAFEGAAARTNAKGQSNAYGLDPKDHTTALAEIRRAGAAGHAEHDRIVDNLGAALTNEKRPTMVSGLAKLVNDEDPKLFNEIIARVESSGGELAAKRLREITAPTPNVRRAAPASLGKMSPEALRAYNEVLRKQGLPEVTQ
jgi:hypothetical protein